MVGKAWPTAASVELLGRGKELGLAANAIVDARPVVRIEDASTRPLSASLASDPELHFGEFGSVFFVRLFRHDVSIVPLMKSGSTSDSSKR